EAADEPENGRLDLLRQDKWQTLWTADVCGFPYGSTICPLMLLRLRSLPAALAGARGGIASAQRKRPLELQQGLLPAARLVVGLPQIEVRCRVSRLLRYRPLERFDGRCIVARLCQRYPQQHLLRSRAGAAHESLPQQPHRLRRQVLTQQFPRRGCP